MFRRHARPARGGFTLIEMMVVIAIIAVMVSLLAAGVQRARMAALRNGDGTDLRKLADSVAVFQEKFKGVEYIPSRLMLCERWDDYTPILQNTNHQDHKLAVDSVTWLLTLWPNLDRSSVQSNQFNHDWNGDGAYTQQVILEGPEVLVFALGGINYQTGSYVGHRGFSTNPKYPATAPTVQAEQRLGPFADFKLERLTTLPTAGGTAGYKVYLNQWGAKARPYAYFSSYGKPNGYSRYGSTDCAALAAYGLQGPYTSSTGKYWNEKTFQIISAGQDGQFGPGGNWPPVPTSNPAGEDDLSNFAKGVLGGGTDN